MPSRSTAAAPAALVLVLLVAACGDHAPGPGGGTISGNVASADTAAVGTGRSWVAWVGEEVLGLARHAWAQAGNTSLEGITVTVRGEGREVSDTTGPSGDFTVPDAPTGEVDLVFDRDGCQGALPLGSVVSHSTITLADVAFSCASGSGAASLSVGSIAESFDGVVRDDAPADAKLCVRVGNDQRTRRIAFGNASVLDRSGRPTTTADVDDNDLLDVQGRRSGAGNTFSFDATRVQIVDENVQDACDDDPLT